MDSLANFAAFATHAFWLLLAFLVLRAAFAILHKIAPARPNGDEPDGEVPQRLTLMQLLIRALYCVAFWCQDFAIAVDRGYLTYRMERAHDQVRPHNEQWQATAALKPESEAIG